MVGSHRSDQGGCNDYAISLRIGVNGGSVRRAPAGKISIPSAEALSESALNAVHAFGSVGFTNMKVSLKASDVHMAVDAYYLFSSNPTIRSTSGSRRQAPP